MSSKYIRDSCVNFYDRNRQLTPHETADELYRYASKLASLVENSDTFTLSKDATSLIVATEEDRLTAFRRRRLTNDEINAYEAFMAAVTFSGTTSLWSDDGRELTYRDYMYQNSSDEAL